MTGARCCGWPTSALSNTTPRWGWPATSTGPTHLVLDLDPPDDDFAKVVAVAHLVRQALADSGLVRCGEDQRRQGYSRVRPDRRLGAGRRRGRGDAGAGRARGGARPGHRDDGVHRGGPRRQGVRRCHPRRRSHGRRGVQPAAAARARRCRFRWSGPSWTRITPADFTVHTALDALDGRPSWTESMPQPQRLPTELIEHGRTIPVARVAAMHEGKRRARARRESP